MDNIRNNMRINSNPSLNPGIIGKGPAFGQATVGGQPQRHASNNMYTSTSSMMSQGHNGSSIDVLTRGLSGMNLQPPAYGMSAKPSPQASTHSTTSGGVPLGHSQPIVVNGQLVWTNGQYYHQNGGYAMPPSSGMFHPVGPHFINQNNYQPFPAQYSDHASSWQSSRQTSAEVPTLITPSRESSSSNEHEAPGTPFTHFSSYGDMRPGIALIDNSPNSLYAWTTPSPSQPGYGLGKARVPTTLPPHLQMLCQQDPAIPAGVPAPFSPLKPLDRALENPHGVTNVYIRGLLPNTDDNMLYRLASRFGDIVSSKSIIDHNTGDCKGFGFVKFHNFKDAEDCIRGFHFSGYETSFARESFYCQLKKLSDEGNTNLYVSNLPKDMNEHELGAIFGPYKVCSSRILRNPDGSGRGVGFARFESRDVCDKVIQDFNNSPVAKPGGDEHLIQIRFADTPEQKALKQQTTAARQYRTAEYESQTQGVPQIFQQSPMGIIPQSGRITDSDFETYVGQMNGKQPDNSPSEMRESARNRLNQMTSHLSPDSVHASVDRTYPEQFHTGSVEDEDKTLTSIATPAIAVQATGSD